MLLHPDAMLKRADNETRFRLGAIVRDTNGRKWGLTARHVFDGVDHAEILTQDGVPFSQFVGADNANETEGDAVGQIVKFHIPDQQLVAEKIRYDVIWPREAVERGSLLGAKVASIESRDRQIGTIIEVDGLSRISFPNKAQPLTLQGTALLWLDAKVVTPVGSAGTLVLSDAGEAIGLGVAVQKTGDEHEVIVCPLDPYLRKWNLRLWAPPGAHWTDLPQRVALFLREAQQDAAPDLGRRPDTSI